MTTNCSFNSVAHVYPNPRNGVNVAHQMFPPSSAGIYPYGHFYNSHNISDHGDQLQLGGWPNHSFGPYSNWGQNPAEVPQTSPNFIQHANHPHSFGLHAPANNVPHLSDPLMPSPPITVSGSDVSSPGGVEAYSPGGPRPGPDRTPFKWMETTQTQPAQGKTRTKDKYRVVYSDNQRLELEKEFHFSKYITIRRKSELATTLALSERQVKIWFQNRRAKERKQSKKNTDKDKLGLHMDHTAPNLQLQHNLHHMVNSGTLHALQHGINHHSLATSSMASPSQSQTQGSLHPNNLGQGIM